MAQSVLRWREGAGWIVLIGGGDLDEGDLDGIYSDIIIQTDMFSPVVYLPAADSPPEAASVAAEAVLETWQDLGGAPGNVLPVWQPGAADAPEYAALTRAAGVVILGDGDDVQALARVLAGTLLGVALADAYAAGAIVVGQGAGAMVLGQQVAQHNIADETFAIQPGLGWVQSAIIEPHFTSLAESTRLQYLLRHSPARFGVGLPERVALALTPTGDVYTLGTGGQATITVVSEANDND